MEYPVVSASLGPAARTASPSRLVPKRVQPEVISMLDVQPAEAAVHEDAPAGAAAGRAGHFGSVVGVDRVGHAGAVVAHGADRVVQDLGEPLEDDGSR
jgi:hypothetical protein